jgi:hypothetical protein
MGWMVSATPRPLYPWKGNRYPLYNRPDGAQGRCGQVRKISPPPEFDPRTVHSETSRYTDWAIPAHFQDTPTYENVYRAVKVGWGWTYFGYWYITVKKFIYE